MTPVSDDMTPPVSAVPLSLSVSLCRGNASEKVCARTSLHVSCGFLLISLLLQYQESGAQEIPAQDDHTAPFHQSVEQL